MRYAHKLLVALAITLAPAFAAAPAWHALAALTADPADILQESQALNPKDGQPVQVLLETSTTQFDTQGRRLTHIRQVYRVDQASALENWGSASTFWEPWREERPVIRARVLTPDGLVHPLDNGTMGEFPMSSQTIKLYDDRRTLAAPLPQICVGALVEIEVVHQDKLPEFKVGSRSIMRVARPFPVGHWRGWVELPETVPIHWKIQGLPGAKVVRTVADGKVRLTLDLGPREPEPRHEALENFASQPEPMFAVTTCPSWAAVARAYDEVVDRQIRGADLSAWLRDAQGAAAPLQDRLNAILTRMNRELQYTGVEFGEAALVPRTPAETLARGYGDCKDKAAFLVALLRGLGTQANLALLVTGPDRDIDPELPGILHFSHAIVVVQGPGGALWVDPTAGTCRAGTLPWQDQNRLALIIAPDTSTLTRTPQSTVEENLEVEWREIHLGESGSTARVVETCRPRGYAEGQLRSQFPAKAGARTQRDNLEKYVKSAYQAQELGSMEMTDSTDLSRPFTLTVEGKGCGLGKTWDTGCEVSLNLWAMTSELRSIIGYGQGNDAPDKRTRELLFPLPVGAEWRYRVIPPYGYALPACPPAENVLFGPASLRGVYSLEGDGTLVATYRFESGKLLWTAEEVEEARSALARWGEIKPLGFTFPQVGEALVKAGKFKEALAAFRGQIADRPDLAALHSHLALALMEVGLGDAARAEARKGWEQNPGSLYTNRTLGWLLARDLVGRAYASGWDQTGSIDAYEKAVAIAPDDQLSRGMLVNLYARNASGDFFGPGTNKEKSIQAIRDYQKYCPDHANDGNLIQQLLLLGRSQEALAFAQSTPEFPNRPQWLAAALLATQKPEAALAILAREVPDPDARKTGLRAAAGSLNNLRLYPAAAVASEAGAEGQLDGNQDRIWATQLRKMTRHEDLNLDPARPETVVKQVLQKILTGGPSAPGFQDLFVPSFSAILSKAKESKDLPWLAGRTLNNLQRSHVDQDVILDFALAEEQFTVEPLPWGNPTFRISVRRPLLQGVELASWFVVRSGSHFRLAGHSGEPVSFASAALASLECQDLVEARNWLDLAFEFTRKGGGGDPAGAHPFYRFWTRGQQGDPDQIRWAAASLLASNQADSRAIPMLLQGKAKRADAATQQAFDLALLEAYWYRSQWPELAAQATLLMDSYPNSPNLYEALATALDNCPERQEELLAISRALVAREPDNVSARESVESSLKALGRYQEYDEFVRKVVKGGKATDEEYNILAWALFCNGGDAGEALELIARSIQLQSKNYYAANTQAVLLAYRGAISNSLSVLLKSLEDQHKPTLEAADWFVLGLIADNLEESDSAVTCYQRARGDKVDLSKTRSLGAQAQKRLDALAKQTGPRPHNGLPAAAGGPGQN